jgi:hypothetical protein
MFAKKRSAHVALSRLLVELAAIGGITEAVQERQITAVRCKYCCVMVTPGQAVSHPCWVARS